MNTRLEARAHVYRSRTKLIRWLISEVEHWYFPLMYSMWSFLTPPIHTPSHTQLEIMKGKKISSTMLLRKMEILIQSRDRLCRPTCKALSNSLRRSRQDFLHSYCRFREVIGNDKPGDRCALVSSAHRIYHIYIWDCSETAISPTFSL